ncbi:MAG: CvpA family protein [Oscillospiraceae bacterium]|nr:CvpA family protein [Oscillospiraceae bacterium]
MSIVLDIILAALIVISFIIGYKKGFVNSVWKIAALIITIVLVMALKNPAIEILSSTGAAESISEKISETVSIPQGGGVNIAESLNLPEFLQSEVSEQISGASGAVTSLNDAVNTSLTGLFITIIVCVGLFIIIRLILAAVHLIINAVTKAPVIKGANKFLGGLLAAVNAVFIAFVLLALVSLFAPADSGLFEMIDNTYVVKYFYNYNILLQLFMKI